MPHPARSRTGSPATRTDCRSPLGVGGAVRSVGSASDPSGAAASRAARRYMSFVYPAECTASASALATSTPTPATHVTCQNPETMPVNAKNTATLCAIGDELRSRRAPHEGLLVGDEHQAREERNGDGERDDADPRGEVERAHREERLHQDDADADEPAVHQVVLADPLLLEPGLPTPCRPLLPVFLHGRLPLHRPAWHGSLTGRRRLLAAPASDGAARRAEPRRDRLRVKRNGRTCVILAFRLSS